MILQKRIGGIALSIVLWSLPLVVHAEGDSTQSTDDTPTHQTSEETRSGWQTIDNAVYYFDADGVAVKGWQTIIESVYYFGEDGRLATGTTPIDGATYLFLADGKMATGWQNIDNQQFYFGEDGVRRQGLHKLGDAMYGFHPTHGYLLHGIHKINSRYYYLNQDGQLQYGLQRIDGKTYGFHPVYGYRLSGKHKLDGHYRYFDSKGRQSKGWRYTTQYEYFSPKLTKKTDWQQIGGKWYYFNSKGKMYKNKRIKNATFNARGVYSPVKTSYKMKVPLYRQFPMGYPSGCEFFSLKMALEKKGRVVSASTLYNKMPKSMWNARSKNSAYVWVDPNVMFTGDPKGRLDRYRNYGIYPKGMIGFSSKYRPVKDLSKQGLHAIERELAMGNPVIVWASVDFKKPYGHFSWRTSSNKKFTGFKNYHVMLATGYDQKNLYVNDPYRGRIVVPKSKVKAVMGATGWKALAVR